MNRTRTSKLMIRFHDDLVGLEKPASIFCFLHFRKKGNLYIPLAYTVSLPF
jgi:lysine/ornithine N-monooxygenase